MNEVSSKIKLQIVEKIKSTTNILVTVSKNPSVDELSAALGLTVLLNKLDKHATAIFSGDIPPAITFLDPDKVFEENADSLRDFIIALDKDKADRLRYKLEDDVVKIFITPYRTKVDENDLEFSQGDYNVELVLALGVSNQENLDIALAADGSIMDDATIITFSVGEQSSKLGSLDWHEPKASSLSEMVSDLATFLNGKDNKVQLDKQISTALLTGIVSATERFSNEHTTSQTMNIAAQLMAAGADQQLIATKLQESHDIQAVPEEKIAENEPVEELPPVSSDGSLNIFHDKGQSGSAKESTEGSNVMPIKNPVPTIDEILAQIAKESELEAAKHDDSDKAEEPSFGGTLNATSEQAADDAKKIEEDDKNKTLLEHNYIKDSDANSQAMNGSVVPSSEPSVTDIFQQSPNQITNNPVESSTLPPVNPTQKVGLPLPPPLPDFSTLPTDTAVPPTLAPTPVAAPASTLPVEPAPTVSDAQITPSTPVQSTLPKEMQPVESTLPPINATPPAPANAQPDDPAQFKIPG